MADDSQESDEGLEQARLQEWGGGIARSRKAEADGLADDADGRVEYRSSHTYEEELAYAQPGFLADFDTYLADQYGPDGRPVVEEAAEDDDVHVHTTDEEEYRTNVVYQVEGHGDIEIVQDEDEIEITVTADSREGLDELIEAVEQKHDAYDPGFRSEPIQNTYERRKRLNGITEELEERYDRVEEGPREGQKQPVKGWEEDTEVLGEVELTVYGDERDATVEILRVRGLHFEGSRVLVDSEDKEFKKEVYSAIDEYVEDATAVEDHEYRFEDIDYDLGWEDVGGLEDQVEALQQNLLDPRRSPDLHEELDIDTSSGALLYGPPGTGKSLIAKTVASELSDEFDEEVGLYRADADQLASSYMGEPTKNIAQVFEEAKAAAPSVILVDEIEGIMSQRQDPIGGAGEERNQMKNTFLSKMDGLDDLGDVMVIGTTNRKDLLDEAVLRGGRLDLQLEIPEPEQPAREEILRIHTEQRYEDKEVAPFEELDYKALARTMEGMTGADIEVVTNRALMTAKDRAEEQLKDDERLAPQDVTVTTDLLKQEIWEYDEEEDVSVGKTYQ
jgi:ATP-dependent 26S proteasome regulatory subunit